MHLYRNPATIRWALLVVATTVIGALAADVQLAPPLRTARVKLQKAKATYYFLQQDPLFRRYQSEVFGLISRDRSRQTSIVLTYPGSGKLLSGAPGGFFGGPSSLDLARIMNVPFRIGSGMYPFQVVDTGSKKPSLSGAFMLYNLDETVSLATLGLSKETQILRPDLVAKARTGTLAKMTVQFDGKDVLTYWMGNRLTPYAGGIPTMEIDFGGTPGISQLKVDNRKQKTFLFLSRAMPREVNSSATPCCCAGPPTPAAQPRRVAARRTLAGEDPVTPDLPPAQQVPEIKVQAHRIEFISNGIAYHGYMKVLAHNEYTAFVRVPCTIPENLLQAARQGTVAKLTIKSEGEAKQDVLEVALSATPLEGTSRSTGGL